MAKVSIVTDTIACLPPEILEEYNIHRISLALNINGKPYLDQRDLAPDEFWRMFHEVKEFTTGAPPLGHIIDIYREASQSTSDIVCTFVSRALSAMHETAVQASEIFKKENPGVNIEIIDSRASAGAQGFIALEMARAAQAGKSLAEVVRVGQEMVPRVKLLVAMETLKYLIKSGRAPKTAYMGELFQVKPIIGMVTNTGLVENLGRVRGKVASMQSIVDMLKDHTDAAKPIHLNVHYTNSITDGTHLRDMVTSQYDCAEVYLTPYTPVMCGHTGPVLALTFYS